MAFKSASFNVSQVFPTVITINIHLFPANHYPFGLCVGDAVSSLRWVLMTVCTVWMRWYSMIVNCVQLGILVWLRKGIVVSVPQCSLNARNAYAQISSGWRSGSLLVWPELQFRKPTLYLVSSATCFIIPVISNDKLPRNWAQNACRNWDLPVEDTDQILEL